MKQSDTQCECGLSDPEECVSTEEYCQHPSLARSDKPETQEIEE